MLNARRISGDLDTLPSHPMQHFGDLRRISCGNVTKTLTRHEVPNTPTQQQRNGCCVGVSCHGQTTSKRNALVLYNVQSNS